MYARFLNLIVTELKTKDGKNLVLKTLSFSLYPSPFVSSYKFFCRRNIQKNFSSWVRWKTKLQIGQLNFISLINLVILLTWKIIFVTLHLVRFYIQIFILIGLYRASKLIVVLANNVYLFRHDSFFNFLKSSILRKCALRWNINFFVSHAFKIKN